MYMHKLNLSKSYLVYGHSFDTRFYLAFLIEDTNMGMTFISQNVHGINAGIIQQLYRIHVYFHHRKKK
jgi:hypothetical protein